MTHDFTDLGSDCTYSTSSTFTETTELWSVYAHTADQCCKACAGTADCVGAQYTAASAELEGPQKYEGFGLHLVNVVSSSTDGGIDVSTLEEHVAARMGDMSAYDQFMDFNVVLYAGEDLPTYADALAADDIDFLSASWSADSGDAWYSVFVYVPHSQMVIELVSQTSPGASYLEANDLTLESRIAPRQETRFADVKADGILEAVAVTRAAYNMSKVEYFYTNAIGAELIHSVDEAGMSRRCYGWTNADADVCFVEREGSVAYDSTFSVYDYEKNMFDVHAAVIGTDVSVHTDKMNDNHYAVDLMGFDGSDIAQFCTDNYDDAFPINYPSTYFAWDCTQDYLIDPTGWSIQEDFTFSSVKLPGCTRSERPMQPRGEQRGAPRVAV